MSRERVALVVYVDLNPTPGNFHSKESARNVIGAILKREIGNYKPRVSIAPAEIQPKDDFDAITVDQASTTYNIEGCTNV